MIKHLRIDMPKGMLRNEFGYFGAFTREQAEGALPNGTRVEKIMYERGDHHKLGAKATILGSIREPYGGRRVMYFIEWDELPRHAVACVENKLGKLAP